MTNDTLRRWAKARWADIQRRELDNSLNVSMEKPLGQWGGHTVDPRLHAHAWMSQITNWSATLLVVADSGMTRYYLYHRKGMKALLTRGASTLREAGWPTEPVAFVEKCRRSVAPILTPLYDLVADAYGDKLNPGRTDVLPGVPRRALLEAFLDMHGHNDPAITFWADERRAQDIPRPRMQPTGKYGVKDWGL